MPNTTTPSTATTSSATTSPDLERFATDGFLLLPDFFTPQDLQPLMDEIAGKVDRLASHLHATGRLAHRHESAGFYQRLTLIERDCPGAATLLHTQGVMEPALAALWSHPRLLDLMERILGTEVSGHPVWNLRCKTPDNPLATVPWHQDTAYLAAGSQSTFQPTAWIPLLDADAVNGTLQFVRGGHHSGRVLPHRLEREGATGRKAGSWYLEIPPTELPPGEVVTVPVPLGSVLLLNQLIPHRSTENRSDRIRWSVDLRWQRPQEPTGMDQIAPPLLMRSRQPGFRIDWGAYLGHNRAEKLAGFRIDDPAQVASGISGPWMKRWAPSEALTSGTPT